jgi:uncharacterized membrane protein YbhN (UPF0104 family)
MDNKRNLAFLAANVVIVVAILYLLSTQIDLSKAVSVISHADYRLIILGAVAYLCVVILTAGRYKVLSDALGSKLSLPFLSKAHLSSLILSDVTPGRVGYAYFAVILGKAKVSASQAARILGVGLAFDFLARALSLAFLVYVASAIFGRSATIAVAICAVTILAVVALSVRNRAVSRLIPRVPLFGEKLSSAYEAIHSKSIGPGPIAYSGFLSVAGTLVRGVGWLLVFNSLLPIGFSLRSVVLFSVTMAVVTGLTFIPISIAGLGVQEGVGAAVFSLLFSQDIAVCAAAMLLCRLMELAIDSTGLLWLRVGKKQAD